MEAWLGTPNKKEKIIELWIDGSCEPTNPGGTACGGYVIKSEGLETVRDYFVVGKGSGMTNNVAEYQALIHALTRIHKLQWQKEFIKIKSDSDLLVNQVNRMYRVKALLIVPLYASAKKLLAGMHYKIEWIPREENDEADRLTHLAYEESLKKKDK